MIGIIAKLKASFLGLTILAIGNALPDALTTIALSKQGYALMGLTGGYAGQLFGLLVGFGLAMFKKCLVDGPQKFDLFKKPRENLLDIIVVLFSLLTLLTTFIYGIYNNFYFGKLIKYILVAYYLIFIVSAIIIQIIMIVNGGDI